MGPSIELVLFDIQWFTGLVITILFGIWPSTFPQNLWVLYVILCFDILFLLLEMKGKRKAWIDPI